MLAFVGLGLSGCDVDKNDGPVRISIIGQTEQLSTPLRYMESLSGQVMLAATAQGLVSYDGAGDVVPGLAQRWIVMDDGKSYIFRLRRANWVNGDRVDARDVQRLLQARIKEALRRDPYGPLVAVTDVLAMTGDVIEIRLSQPQPDFLLLLAQPSMGIAQRSGGTGPYEVVRDSKDKSIFILTPMKEEDAPVPVQEQRMLQAERASRAIMRFQDDGADMVTGGTLADIPYVTLASVNSRLVQFDPVQGLFGLALSTGNPLLDDAAVRQALSMGIEREAIIGYFAIQRWKIADSLLPQSYDLPRAPTMPEWAEQSLEERRAYAAGVITRWRAQNDDKPAEVTISLPPGPGMGLLFTAIKAQLRAIGVTLHQVPQNGDLRLIDEVAPYNSAYWYLGRISCARKVHCSKEADAKLMESARMTDPAERAKALGEAEYMIQRHGGYIPLAMPLRWSLVSPRINGFRPSVRGIRGLRSLIE